VLRRGDRVRRGQQTIKDAEPLVHDVDQRRRAIRRTRSVRNYRHSLLITVEVHAPHEHRRVFARRADDHFLGTGRYVFLKYFVSEQIQRGFVNLMSPRPDERIDS